MVKVSVYTVTLKSCPIIKRNQQPKKILKKNKKLDSKFYKISDSRAPEHTEVLFDLPQTTKKRRAATDPVDDEDNLFGINYVNHFSARSSGSRKKFKKDQQASTEWEAKVNLYLDEDERERGRFDEEEVQGFRDYADLGDKTFYNYIYYIPERT